MTYQIPVRTSQETYYLSVTEPNWVMPFRETVAVYCENHTEHTDTPCGLNAIYIHTYKFSSYLTGNTLRLRHKAQYLTWNTLRLRHKAQLVNAVWRNLGCILWEPYGTHIDPVWVECNIYIYIYIYSFRTSQETYYLSVIGPKRLMLFREAVAVYCENHTDHTDTLCG
jgi:hypothetical protein